MRLISPARVVRRLSRRARSDDRRHRYEGGTTHGSASGGGHGRTEQLIRRASAVITVAIAAVVGLGAVGCGGGSAADEALGRELIEAARAGDAERVRGLLEREASVDVRDAAGATALVAAAYGNHVGVARLLVEAGADVNAKDDTVQSAYLIATSEVGDDPRLLELALANGADVGSLDSFDGTGLIRAADRGFVTVVRRLLETDIDADHVNNLGWTALLEAIILGGGDEPHTEVVQLLVAAGADPNLADGEGVTPLAHARRRGYARMVEILERAGAQR